MSEIDMGMKLGEHMELAHWITSTLEAAAGVIDLIGITIILWGFVQALSLFIKVEFKRLTKNSNAFGLNQVRYLLGTYILVGIEFMIASDIINTVLKRELEDLVFVSALVAIRTAISFFLGKELMELASVKKEK